MFLLDLGPLPVGALVAASATEGGVVLSASIFGGGRLIDALGQLAYLAVFASICGTLAVVVMGRDVAAG